MSTIIKDKHKYPFKDPLNIALSLAFVVLSSLFCWAAKYPLILPVLFLLMGVYYYYSQKAGIRTFIHLGLLLSLIIFAAHIILNYSTLPYFVIPVASVAMLTVLLFNDLHLAFLMAIVSSLMVSLGIGGDFKVMFTFWVGSLTGAFYVREARTRGQLIVAGLVVTAIQILSLILLNPDWNTIIQKSFVTNYIYPLIFNGLTSVFVVLSTLKIFEYAFGVLTNFSLLELSDFNHPLLKRMILEAPGTYHHSLIVSNLAEAAAESIGASGLLSRVGAYYHDIGKLEKPEYFTENQIMGGNKHDLIEPSMSRLVVLNHVKEGIEMGQKYKLNQMILQFIPEHHGTSLMHYFYQKALEEAKEGEAVEEIDYRYPGPKPQSRETAIVMLADSSEGATRSLDDPTPNMIEDTVKKVINNKFIDGQLDECHLTLKEIEKISATFIHMLTAMYHARIKYPEKKNGSHGKKPSEKNSPQLPPDSPAHPQHL